MELGRGSFDKHPVRPERQSAPVLRPQSSSCIGFGARFKGELLHRMDGNRRADFDRRFFLLHLDPQDGASMQCHRKDERCHHCPFARRFVYRCRRHHVPPLRPVCCWRSPYPDHPSVWRYLRGFQCCSLHMSVSTRGLIRPANMTLCTMVSVRIRL